MARRGTRDAHTAAQPDRASHAAWRAGCLRPRGAAAQPAAGGARAAGRPDAPLCTSQRGAREEDERAPRKPLAQETELCHDARRAEQALVAGRATHDAWRPAVRAAGGHRRRGGGGARMPARADERLVPQSQPAAAPRDVRSLDGGRSEKETLEQRSRPGRRKRLRRVLIEAARGDPVQPDGQGEFPAAPIRSRPVASPLVRFQGRDLEGDLCRQLHRRDQGVCLTAAFGGRPRAHVCGAEHAARGYQKERLRQAATPATHDGAADAAAGRRDDERRVERAMQGVHSSMQGVHSSNSLCRCHAGAPVPTRSRSRSSLSADHVRHGARGADGRPAVEAATTAGQRATTALRLSVRGHLARAHRSLRGERAHPPC